MREYERIAVLRNQIKEMDEDFGFSVKDLQKISGKLAEAQRAKELGLITDEEMRRKLTWLIASLESLEEKLETSHFNGQQFLKGVA